MTQTVPATSLDDAPTGHRSRWPLYGAAAGVLGFVATLVTDGRGPQPAGGVRVLDPALYESLNPLVFRTSMITGYVVVALLLVLAAVWRRRVEPRVPHSTAARVVSGGLVASAAALTFGYGWKGALGLYLPGGPEGGSFDTAGLAVYLMLCDFGAWIGWLGVAVTAGGIAWMALRERTVSRWIGVFSVVAVLAVAAFVAGLGVAGFPGVVMPLWLAIAFTGLAFGRSTISR